jgi:hypothetical protein
MNERASDSLKPQHTARPMSDSRKSKVIEEKLVLVPFQARDEHPISIILENSTDGIPLRSINDGDLNEHAGFETPIIGEG